MDCNGSVGCSNFGVAYCCAALGFGDVSYNFLEPCRVFCVYYSCIGIIAALIKSFYEKNE